uniref:hypothetical protein n=1 Tax=Streptomyces turgidiscabies TaxID=85558 RepID=UPI0038F7B3D1
TKVIKSQQNEEPAQKFKQYFDWQEPLHRIPSHRLLAILRAEHDGFIKKSITVDQREALHQMERAIIKAQNESADQLKI